MKLSFGRLKISLKPFFHFKFNVLPSSISYSTLVSSFVCASVLLFSISASFFSIIYSLLVYIYRKAYILQLLLLTLLLLCMFMLSHFIFFLIASSFLDCFCFFFFFFKTTYSANEMCVVGLILRFRWLCVSFFLDVTIFDWLPCLLSAFDCLDEIFVPCKHL